MHALDLLIADHNRFRGLFAQFEDAQEAKDDDRMSAVALKIMEDLDVHTALEEEIFYPAIRDTSEDIAETVDEGIQEHHVARLVMAEVKQIEDGTDEWIAKMTVIIEGTEHHIKEEEEELFPPVRSALPNDELHGLADRMEARKAELGAPVLADKIDLTKAELLELAKQQSIPGRSSMSQEQLAATVAPASA